MIRLNGPIYCFCKWCLSIFTLIILKFTLICTDNFFVKVFIAYKRLSIHRYVYIYTRINASLSVLLKCLSALVYCSF